MQIERIAVVLRPRSPWEAMELGSALVRRNAGAIWKPWLALTLPVFALVNALGWIFDHAWWALMAMWWLKPLFDRVVLHVLSRAVFAETPGVAATLRAQLKWGLPRPMLDYLAWRRLGPARALFLPVEGATATAVQPVMTNEMLVVLAVLCTAAGFVFTRLNVPAGYVLGAMAAATAAKLGGLFDGVLPPPLQIASYVLIGGLIGARFIGITMTEFRRAALGGFIATVMTVAIVTVIAFIASLFVEMPFGQLWLGLSPGALEGMGALGVVLGYDTAFIAAHHVARLLMLTAAIPSVAFLLSAAERKRA